MNVHPNRELDKYTARIHDMLWLDVSLVVPRSSGQSAVVNDNVWEARRRSGDVATISC